MLGILGGIHSAAGSHAEAKWMEDCYIPGLRKVDAFAIEANMYVCHLGCTLSETVFIMLRSNTSAAELESLRQPV